MTRTRELAAMIADAYADQDVDTFASFLDELAGEAERLWA